MATDLSSITTGATALGNLILVSPQKTIGYQPQNGPVVGGKDQGAYANPAIVFHYEGEQTAQISSDITDHYIENNTAVNDQISLKPVMITTNGFIGDLNNVPPNKVLQVIQQQVVSRLAAVSGYAPGLSVTALNAYNEALFLYQTGANLLASAVSTWGALSGSNSGLSVISGTTLAKQNNQSPQQTYYQLFFGYWSSRTLFTVQTPWAVFQNMAIASMRAIQDAETNSISDFEVTFKQMNFATTATTLGAVNSSFTGQGRQPNQLASNINLGVGSLGPTNSLSVGP